MNGCIKEALSAKCSQDLRELHKNFFSCLDPSRLEQAAGELSRDPGAWASRMIGEGSDCCAYLLPGQQLVLTMPKPEFWRRTLSHRWKMNLDNLKNLGPQPLLPPLHIVPLDDTFMLVTPYGDSESTHAAVHWQPLSKWIEFSRDLLQQNGLVIDDLIQIRCRGEIPFIVDFSDLRFSG